MKTEKETKNLIGKNIEYFRKRLKYTRKKIAEIIGVNSSLMTYYEQGKRVPTIGKLDKMAEVFGIPVEWLMMENPQDIQYAARSQGKETKPEIKEVLFFQKMMIDFVDLFSRLGIPDYKYKGPRYPGQKPKPGIAEIVKKLLGLPDIIFYEKFKEMLHVIFNVYIFEIPFKNENISGVTFYREEVFCVFINKGHTKQRRFFSLAHELGHILFHIADDSYLVSRLASTNPFEKEANQFANMLLLPEKHFNRAIDKKNLHLYKKEYIQELADFFHVSPESVFYSLAKKGLVQYNWKSYKPDTTYPGNYNKKWTYKDLPWIYIMTAYLAYQQDIVSLSRFSQLLFTGIREAQQIIKDLDEILENSDNTEH